MEAQVGRLSRVVGVGSLYLFESKGRNYLWKSPGLGGDDSLEEVFGAPSDICRRRGGLYLQEIGQTVNLTELRKMIARPPVSSSGE